MGLNSQISWCDHTWNIAIGCTKVDKDCLYCYMYRDGDRYKYDAKVVKKTKTVFNLPLKIKESSRIFTSSLTDVFHPDCDSFRNEMWDIIRKCPQHTFQILTKRPERMIKHLPEDWGDGWDNVWLGTSVGSVDAFIERCSHLCDTPAKIRFLSIEPLHSRVPLMISKEFIHWVIVGGESGNENGKYRYRPCKLEWIELIIRRSQKEGVPVFVKQLGTHLSKEMGLKDRHGGNIEEWPEHLQIREFPK